MRKSMKRHLKTAVWIIVLCAVILTGCGSTKPSESSAPQNVIRSSNVLSSTPTPVPTLRPFDHNDIKMQNVDSSSLAKVGYDPDYSVLKVQFKNSGEFYIYFDVPQSTYAELLNAESIGSYFYYNVRTSFEYEKVS